MTTQSDQSLSAIERANIALIRYPRFRDLHNEIRRCQQISRQAGEPQCMSLEGRTGAGKTTLVREYTKAFPRIETPIGTHVPVFYLETPSPVRIKGMAAAMLEALGDPAAHRGTQWSMNSRLVKLLIACKVELVILDDFQHMIDSETKRVLVEASDWLKVLIKETGVPFLVVGIEGKVEQVLKANDQLSRLFAAREELHPFRWETNDTATIVEFGQFVQYAERAIEMPTEYGLPREEVLYRLYYATDGVVANIMNLIRYAQIFATERKSTVVELIDLKLAFDKRLAKHLRTKVNPFTDTVAFTLSGQAPTANTDPAEGVSKRGRSRKPPKPTIAETLKAS